CDRTATEAGRAGDSRPRDCECASGSGRRQGSRSPIGERLRTMQRYRFPIAVALTSLGLVAALVVVGGLVVGNALAQGPWFRGPGFGPWSGGHGPWAGAGLPPQLAGLHDVP